MEGTHEFTLTYLDGRTETFRGWEKELEELRTLLTNSMQFDPDGIVRMRLSSGDTVIRVGEVSEVGLVQ